MFVSLRAIRSGLGIAVRLRRAFCVSRTTLVTCPYHERYYRALPSRVRMGPATVTRQKVDMDRAAFNHTLHLQALRIPKKDCQKYMKQFQGYDWREELDCHVLLSHGDPCYQTSSKTWTANCKSTLDRARIPCIVTDNASSDTKLLILGEHISGPDLEGLKDDLRRVVQEDHLTVTPYDLTIGYAHLTADQVLKKLLPEGVEVPSSFETVGHIAHLNLREEVLPYKHVIGQVLLDKNPHIKTVVNKVASIENEFRVSELEVVAGEDRLETEVRQYNARFRLNFSEVYWNSRLEAEHKRLVDMMGSGAAILDVMAGIGPFSIPAAQRNCRVYANDLNPRSFHWLQKNIALNKVGDRVFPFCMDGRMFVRYMCGAGLSGTPGGSQAVLPEGFERPEGGVIFEHAIMNLPASAVSFLDAFRGAFNPVRWEGSPLPTIHCYTFSQGSEDDCGVAIAPGPAPAVEPLMTALERNVLVRRPRQKISAEWVQQRVEAALGGALDHPPTIRFVRDVAPNKRMLCVSFRVPRLVAFDSREPSTITKPCHPHDDGLEPPSAKRPKAS